MIVKKSRKSVAPRKVKEQSVSQLKKRLDGIFSRYIRIRDGGRCFTCGVSKPIQEMQCGHYISRSHNNTRFDEQNCHCQCVGCNIFRHGNMDEYAQNLEAEYGTGILQTLAQRKRVIRQFSKGELKELIYLYEHKITNQA